jgi:nicotinate-nucleotide pyrophosphorylase
MRFNTTAEANGIFITQSSRITFQHSGVYNIQFSAQVEKTDSGSDEIEIWLSKNGQNVNWSNTTLELQGNSTELVAAWNFMSSFILNYTGTQTILI